MSNGKKQSDGNEEAYAAIQALIAKGRKDGYLRASELNAELEKLDISPEKIEEFYDRFDALSITIVSDDVDLDVDIEEELDDPTEPVAGILGEILGTLPKWEADVLRMRFGMYDGRTHTLEEVGQIFGVTRERIRQIENKAIRKCRPRRAKKIRDLYC